MNLSNDQHNEAMVKFLVNRYEQVVGVTVVDYETYEYDSALERIQTHNSDFFG